MKISFFEIFWGIGGLIVFFWGIRIYIFKIYKQTIKNKPLDYFAKFLILSGLGFILAAPSGSIIKELVFLKIIIPIFYFLLFTAAAYLSRVLFIFLNSNLEDKVFWIVMFFNFLFIFFLIKDFLYSAQSVHSIMINQKGLSTMVFPPAAQFLDIIICVVALLIPGILFIFKGIKSGDRKVMIRAILLGVGLVFFAIGGATYTIANSAFFSLISSISLSVGFISVLFGVFYYIERNNVKN